MSKSNNHRPVTPCWYCGSCDVAPVTPDRDRFYDIRDTGWWECLTCSATIQEKPTSRGSAVRKEPSSMRGKKAYG